MKKTGPNYDQNIVCTDNPGQNIWDKIEKFTKTGQEKKSLISAFVYFFGCYCQSGNSGRETLGYVSTKIWDFPNISLFRKILSLSATREANCIPSLLWYISSYVLLVVNRICTKTLQNSKSLQVLNKAVLIDTMLDAALYSFLVVFSSWTI